MSLPRAMPTMLSTWFDTLMVVLLLSTYNHTAYNLNASVWQAHKTICITVLRVSSQPELQVRTFHAGA